MQFNLMINEINSYFSSLKVMHDIDFCGDCFHYFVYLHRFGSIFVIYEMRFKISLVTLAIFSSKYDIKPTFERRIFS